MIKWLLEWFKPKECLHQIVSHYDYNDGYTTYICRKCGDQLYRGKV